MNHPQLDKARAWTRLAVAHETSEVSRAAAEVIQSLPDEWIDADKLRDVINEQLSSYPHGTAGHRVAEKIACKLEALFSDPQPRTLADMTPDEREACQWMQAKTWHEVGIILWVDELTEIAQLITRANGVLERKFKDVTPLPGEPKMKWPAQEQSNG